DRLRADCHNLPFRSASFELVVAFEMRPELVREARRVLVPAGELIRFAAGRELAYQELRPALTADFPHARVFRQNHSEAVIFSLPEVTEVETFLEVGPADSGAADFLVAICSAHPLPPSVPFVYIPLSGNILREREKHIALLREELKQKDQWLQQTRRASTPCTARTRRSRSKLPKTAGGRGRSSASWRPRTSARPSGAGNWRPRSSGSKGLSKNYRRNLPSGPSGR
ncbi:MAG: hypothetical protein HY238_20105, partial [Acidobacteria bacterium]|nr:hypothetical protein [Acidobacteriota bacterium]